MTAEKIAPPPPSRTAAFRYWLKLGFISFGGPAGQISIMHQELVERRRWISERRFLHALNYCMVLPGPEAQQLATYIGWLLHGAWGGLIAGGLFVLPSLLVLIALSWIYLAFGATPLVASVLYGIKPAVTAIVLFAAYRIGSRALKNRVLWIIAAAAFLAIFAFELPFPTIVLGAGIIGYLGDRFAPAAFHAASGHHTAQPSFGPALIDDGTPPPAHACFRWPRALGYALIGVLLWIGTLGALVWFGGWSHPYAQMGWLFTKAALVTFGGAYAVLPYVYQAGVATYGWLTAPQMIDGLALGETTPGPLIMVVAFVGFLGGWNHAALGDESLALAGVIGACVATFFTFLPSFLFILIGAPLVESTRDDLKFTAPLSAITAAVVGVIINLALFFAYHVLWPHGFAGPFDGVSALIGLAAGVALFRLRIGVIAVIAACAALGVIMRWLAA
ncbi:MAG: chromate efflux transporter [Gammaproteobacteria bacterium]